MSVISLIIWRLIGISCCWFWIQMDYFHCKPIFKLDKCSFLSKNTSKDKSYNSPFHNKRPLSRLFYSNYLLKAIFNWHKVLKTSLPSFSLKIRTISKFYKALARYAYITHSINLSNNNAAFSEVSSSSTPFQWFHWEEWRTLKEYTYY